MDTKTIGTLLAIGIGSFAWAATPVEIALGESLLIDDFADENMQSALGAWSVYPDASGESTVQHSFVSKAGVNGASKALRVDYSLNGYDILNYEPFMEIKAFVGRDSTARDMSSCNEIQYDYRGNHDHWFKVVSNIDVEDNYHRQDFYGSRSWNTAVVRWNNLYQYDLGVWGREANINDVQKNLVGFVWQVQDYDGTEGFLEIANVRCFHKQAYAVKFYWGERLLDSTAFLAGDKPYFRGPNYFDTPQYRYEIREWNPTITEVSANASYYAVMDSSIRTYEVRFKDDEDNTLIYQELEYGTVPSYVGLNPVKLPSKGFTYTFKGWGKRSCSYGEVEHCDEYDDCYTTYDYICHTEYEKNLSPVKENITYYPVFDSVANTYTVKFADYDGKVLSEKQYAYGTKSSDITVPNAPSRASKNGIEYTFEGWIPDISKVKNDVVYVASYSAMKDGEAVEYYTVTFANGAEILQVGEFEAGEYPEYTGEIPTKESTAQLDYTFEAWEDQNGWSEEDIYENKIYMALFDEQYRKYWIVFQDENGAVLDSVQYEYGSKIYTYELDFIDELYENGYEVSSLTPKPTRVTGRAVYQANIRYRVRFVDKDGHYGDYNWYDKGDMPDCRNCEPTREPTPEFTYEFVGWNKEFAPVTDTATYLAVFVKKPVAASTVVNITEGNSLLIDDFEDGNEISLQGGEWFVYSDSGKVDEDSIPYASQISKTVTARGNNGKALDVEYWRECHDEKGGYECRGWLGVGVKLASNNASVDFSQCNAISYEYRGAAHDFRVRSVYDVDKAHLKKHIESSDKWTTAMVYRDEFDYWWGENASPEVAFTHATEFLWDNMESEGSLEIDNVKCLHMPKFIVKFFNGETLVDSATFLQGQTPYYAGNMSEYEFVEGMDNEQYYYEFAGWTPELAPVTGNAVYKTSFNKIARQFDVCFSTSNRPYYYYDNDQECIPVEYGKIPDYKKIPTREATESCNEYEFTHWEYCSYNDDKGYVCIDTLAPVTDNMTYRAQFNCKDPVMHTITYLDENGDTIYSKKYNHGEYAEYVYPQKESTAKYRYRYVDMEPSFEYGQVLEDQTYTVEFDAQIRTYEATFVEPIDGWDYIDYPEYGTLYKDLNPSVDFSTILSKDGARFELVGWSPDRYSDKDSIVGDVTFIAQYDTLYAVKFVDYNGNSIEVNGESEHFYRRGTSLANIAVPESPIREAEDSCEYVCDENDENCEYVCNPIDYTFAGWMPAINVNESLTKSMTFVATYTSAKKKHVVVFMDGADILYQEEVAEGDLPEFPEYMEPYRPETPECTYTWDGWDKTIVAVTGPTVYNAKFTKNMKTFEVVFIGEDGNELKRGNYEYGSKVTDAPTVEQLLAGRTGEYRFNGWKEEWWSMCDLDTVLRDMTCYADMEYRVKFYDSEGNLLNASKYENHDSFWYSYGDEISYCENEKDYCDKEIPTKESTAEYDYEWNRSWTPELENVTGPANYVAQFDSTKRWYEVAFEDDDGNTIMEPMYYPYGTLATDITLPPTPTKESTEYVTYTFAGWSLDKVTSNVTYRASFRESPRMYLVKFVDEDGKTLIDSASYTFETPASKIAMPTAPVKTGFQFIGWTPDIADVTTEATYKAIYRSTTRSYKVRFANYDGTILDSATYAFGTPAATLSIPEVPERPSNENYIYTFVGWTPEISDVTDDVTYTALFGNSKRTYTVTFKHGNGKVYDTEQYYYNEVVQGMWGPEKITPECYYDFDKWVRTIGASDTVKGDMEYTATYSSQCHVRKYDVVFYDDIQNLWTSERNLLYGTKASELNVPEIRDTTIDGCEYKFVGWNPEITDVTGDEYYKAVYDKICPEQYIVTWLNYNGTQLGKTSYSTGEKPKYEGKTPVKESSTLYTYRFIGWTPKIVEVTQDARYTAKFDSTSRLYEITFKDIYNHAGFVDSVKILKYTYGTKAGAIDIPELADTTIGLCTYTFDGWDKAIADVTENATYVATYAKQCVEPPPSSSSVKSSSSVASSSSAKPSSSSVASSSSAKSSSSSAKSSSSSAKSSSSVTPKSSSSGTSVSSSSSAKSSSSSTKQSSSSAKSSSSSAKSSSSATPSSSSKEKTGIAMFDLQGSFKMGFARNVFTVTMQEPSNVRIQVFDVNGLLIENFNEYVSGTRSFNLNHLEHGNYIVRAWSGSSQRTARIVIR